MSCPKCGATIPEGTAFCPGCGQPLISIEPPDQEETAPSRAVPQASPRRVAYAGFWLRAIAFLIDTIVTIPIPLVVFIRAGLIDLHNPQPFNQAFMEQHFQLFLTARLTVFVITGIYYSLMESSPWQATLGKRVLGLKVTDLAGKRLSFARATGRYFCRIVSEFTFTIGYLMAGYTPRKQALHDMISECLVVRGGRS